MPETERGLTTPLSLRQVPERVRIPLGPDESIIADCVRPDLGPAGRSAVTPPVAAASPAPVTPPAAEALSPAGSLPAHSALIAVIEAVPSGAEELISAAAAAFEAAGRRIAIVSLDKQNRLAARFGLAPTPSWLWSQASPELFTPSGNRMILPGPGVEAEVTKESVDRVIGALLSRAQVTLVDLGCRWEPRLFQSVLFHASEILVLTRSGQWSGAEMRLEQAELSGWTDLRKLRLVVIGTSGPPPGMLGSAVAAVLPEPGGRDAQDYVVREVGRSQR